MAGVVLIVSLLVLILEIVFIAILNSVVRSKRILDEAIIRMVDTLSTRLRLTNILIRKTEKSHENLIYIDQLTSKCKSLYRKIESFNYSNAEVKLLSDIENSLSEKLLHCMTISDNLTDQNNNRIYQLQKVLSVANEELQKNISYLNRTINRYNIVITTFPGKLIVLMKHFKPFDTFYLKQTVPLHNILRENSAPLQSNIAQTWPSN